jgi:hypothetical protein
MAMQGRIGHLLARCSTRSPDILDGDELVAAEVVSDDETGDCGIDLHQYGQPPDDADCTWP